MFRGILWLLAVQNDLCVNHWSSEIPRVQQGQRTITKLKVNEYKCHNNKVKGKYISHSLHCIYVPFYDIKLIRHIQAQVRVSCIIYDKHCSFCHVDNSSSEQF